MICVLAVSSRLKCWHLVKESKSQIIRNVSILHLLKNQSVLLDKSKHKVIYEFPFMSQTSFFIKSKFWIPAVMIVASPVAYFVSNVGATIFTGLLGCCIHSCFVHFISKKANNMIGKVYVNEVDKYGDVIISSVDSNGNRIDRLHKRNELVVCDFATKISQILGFATIYVENSGYQYHMNVITCKIHDKEKYISLFGNLYLITDKLEEQVKKSK